LSRVSNFELNQTADGAFELIGEMSFETVAQILKSSEQSFAQHAETQVNLSQVGKADSAGLALLLEWKAQARNRNAVIRFVAVPDSLLAIAKTTEVSDLIVD
jgi:phospholipid transport system transporter-binding protein